MRQTPANFGLARPRWRLDDLANLPAVLPWLAGYTRSGIAKALRRGGLSRQRGAFHLHSPDPAYAEKTARIARWMRLAARYPDQCHVLFADECSVYRYPTLADTWAPVGEEPRAALSCHHNARLRIGGALNVQTGAVHLLTRSRFTVPAVVTQLGDLRRVYPRGRIVLIWDNWPVHAHPRVMAAAAQHRITLVWLPTYAPRTNPIEQRWRWLRQDLLHHRQSGDLAGAEGRDPGLAWPVHHRQCRCRRPAALRRTST